MTKSEKVEQFTPSVVDETVRRFKENVSGIFY